MLGEEPGGGEGDGGAHGHGSKSCQGSKWTCHSAERRSKMFRKDQVIIFADMRKVEILPRTDFWGFEISSK